MSEVDPDERLLRGHLEAGEVRAGDAAGRWHVVDLTWPHLTVLVSAAPRETSPTTLTLRLECQGYPQTALTGGLWDPTTGTFLAPDRRPRGERAGLVFRSDSWQGGPNTMYAAWDRAALQVHPEWVQTYPLSAWNPTRTVAFVLNNVYEVLNADDYLGT